MKNEITLLAHLHHPSILEFYGMASKRGSVMESDKWCVCVGTSHCAVQAVTATVAATVPAGSS